MSNYETKIKLPGGHLYTDHPELSEEITLSMLTTKDERKIFGSTSDDTLRNVIKGITDPSVDINDLTAQDRLYLMIELRKHTYGTKYHITDTCEHCHERSEFSVDLLDLDLVELDPEQSIEFVIEELPISKDKLKMKLLTYGESIANRKRAIKLSKDLKVPVAELEIGYTLEKMLLEVNDEVLDTPKKAKYINELVGMDSAYIQDQVNKQDYGYLTKMLATCPYCGEETSIDFEFNSEFFRPRFD